MPGHQLDDMAWSIFLAAMKEDRCGELLQCLFENGSATVSEKTGKLELISGEQMGLLAEQFKRAQTANPMSLSEEEVSTVLADIVNIFIGDETPSLQPQLVQLGKVIEEFFDNRPVLLAELYVSKLKMPSQR